MEVWNKTKFLSIPSALRTIDPSAKPTWGIMSPQHMVEHLVGTWRISNGRAQAPVLMKGEELVKRRAFIFGDAPYDKNITNPVFGDGLAKLRKSDYNSAIDQLEDEMKEFFDYHRQNPEAIESHPVFGDLNYSEWLLFQTKHMAHHLVQFGL